MDPRDKIEPLEKAKCVRCGKPNMNGSKGGRCRACMNKLTRKRHTAGSKERAWKHADQALRREQGRSGTTTGGHKSGHGIRQAIQRKIQRAEKRTGQKLSLDRKNNERGYESKNTRAVPERLNIGRHHVNNKKLRAWQSKLSKMNISHEEMYTYLLAKAEQQGNVALINLLNDMHYNDIATFMNNEDC